MILLLEMSLSFLASEPLLEALGGGAVVPFWSLDPVELVDPEDEQELGRKLPVPFPILLLLEDEEDVRSELEALLLLLSDRDFSIGFVGGGGEGDIEEVEAVDEVEPVDDKLFKVTTLFALLTEA